MNFEDIKIQFRDSKFRAWDSIKKDFIYKEFHLIGECTAFNLINQYKLSELNDLIITQYTGSIDINAVDICEGDIVKIIIDDYDIEVDWEVEPLIIPTKEVISYIEYRQHGFWIKDEGFGYEGEELWDWDQIEVIGNIFENPELYNI